MSEELATHVINMARTKIIMCMRQISFLWKAAAAAELSQEVDVLSWLPGTAGLSGHDTAPDLNSQDLNSSPGLLAAQSVCFIDQWFRRLAFLAVSDY